MYDFRNEIGGYFDALNSIISKMDRDSINDAMNIIMNAYQNDSTIYIFGNGGSASTASHFVCDFNKGVSLELDKKFKFICLNDNVPSIMAIANDCGYERIFYVQLEGRLKKDDVIMAISGSGNSKNIITAVEYARSIGSKIIGITGYDGGKLKALSDCSLHADVRDMQKAEDIHMILGHTMSQIIAKTLGHPMC